MPSTTPDREQRIRERAYYLWLAAGRPHGAALLHWRQAEAIEDGAAGDLQADEASQGNVSAGVPGPQRARPPGRRT
jgi:hypothetical protein